MMSPMSVRMAALSMVRILCLRIVMQPAAVLRTVAVFTGLMLCTAAVAAVLMCTFNPAAGNRAGCRSRAAWSTC